MPKSLRGAGVVESGGCNDCHTNPSFTPASRSVQGSAKAGEPGGVHGRRHGLRPVPVAQSHPECGRTGHGQHQHVMRTGTDLRKLHEQISPLLQVMPWPVYQDMTDKDLEAVFA